MPGGYDEGYQQCSCFWGRKPGSLVLLLERYLKGFAGLSVLDAGCGEGKNAAYLATKGARVFGLDISDLAIDNARTEWPSVPNLRFSVGDVRAINFASESFDLVIAYGLLHCLPDVGAVNEMVNKLQGMTRVGGWNVVCTFNDRYQELHAHPGFTPTLMAHEVVCGFYHDWIVVHASDTDLVETHPHNQIEHTHSMTRVLAKKV